MKKLFLLFSTIGFFNAQAESISSSESLDAWTARRVQETPPRLDDRRPNEIRAGRLTYSGAAIEALKIDYPLELINPAAPLQYGFAEANLVRDPINGKVSGLKIFSIEF